MKPGQANGVSHGTAFVALEGFAKVKCEGDPKPIPTCKALLEVSHSGVVISTV